MDTVQNNGFNSDILEPPSLTFRIYSGKGLKIKVHRTCVGERTNTGRPFITERKRIQFQTQKKIHRGLSISVANLEGMMMI
jgi:hypothetical protein